MSTSILNPLYYIYPLKKEVSFRVIAEKHIKQLRKHLFIRCYDDSVIATVLPLASIISKLPIILHPYFYQMRNILNIYPQEQINVIGIDVADTNHLTEYAVSIANKARTLIVPSTFAQRSYITSGVKSPTYVIPHGVEESWIKTPKQKPRTFAQLASLKDKGKIKLIQSWIMHSGYRKGEDLLMEYWNNLLKERGDVALLIKGQSNITIYKNEIKDTKEAIKIPTGWITEGQKMELMDICDMFILTSRGGGFEHPPLEALSRGEIVLGAEGGSWQDYLPEYLLVKSHESEKIFVNNPIHDGTGVEMEIDDAVEKTCTILDNIQEYQSKVREYISEKIKEKLTWEKIGEKLVEIIGKSW